MIFILCHSLRWIPNIWELKHSGLKKVTGEKDAIYPVPGFPSSRPNWVPLTRKRVFFSSFGSKGGDHRVYRVSGFLSCRPNWVPPPPHPQGSVVSPFGQAFFPVVRIGSDHALTRKGVLFPSLDPKRETTEYTECQAFLPVVRIGSPSPARECCFSSLWVQEGRNTRLRVRA